MEWDGPSVPLYLSVFLSFCQHLCTAVEQFLQCLLCFYLPIVQGHPGICLRIKLFHAVAQLPDSVRLLAPAVSSLPLDSPSPTQECHLCGQKTALILLHPLYVSFCKACVELIHWVCLITVYCHVSISPLFILIHPLLLPPTLIFTNPPSSMAHEYHHESGSSLFSSPQMSLPSLCLSSLTRSLAGLDQEPAVRLQSNKPLLDPPPPTLQRGKHGNVSFYKDVRNHNTSELGRISSCAPVKKTLPTFCITLVVIWLF